MIAAACSAEAHAARAIESALNQSLGSVELIVAVWGPKDGTAALARRFGERDARVEVLETEAVTRMGAFAAALRAARGSYVMLLDAEDWLAPQALEQAHVLMLNKNLDVAFLGVAAEIAGKDVAVYAESRCLEGMRAVSGSEARGRAACLLNGGFLLGAEGALVRRTVAHAALDEVEAEAGDAAGVAEAAWMAACLDGARRVGSGDAAAYRLTLAGAANRTRSAESDAGDAVRAQVGLYRATLTALLEAFKRWDVADTDEGAEALQTAFMRAMVACVTAVCERSCPLDPEGKRGAVGELVRSDVAQEIMGARLPRDLMRRYFAHAVLKRDVNLCYLEGCLMSVAGADRLFPLRA